MTGFFLIVCLLFCVYSAHGGVPGAHADVETSDNDVLEAALFASRTAFPQVDTTLTVTSATKQVVAGVRYDITANVVFPGGSCDVYHFEVWNRFGLMKLMESEQMKGEQCSRLSSDASTISYRRVSEVKVDVKTKHIRTK